jgi:hypothetical protein
MKLTVILISWCSLAHLAWAQTNLWYEQGEKKEGRKVGIWTYFDSPDNPGLIFNHSNDSALFVRADTTKNLVKGTDWELLATDYPARVKGSYEPLYTYLQLVITNYTRKLIKNASFLSDRVYIGFVVDSLGTITDVSVLKSENAELNKLLVAAFVAAPFEWIPAMKGHKKLTSILAIPIVFCTDCENHLPREIERESLPLPCPVLPQIMIQQKSIKAKGYRASRSDIVQTGMNRKGYGVFSTENALYEHMDWSMDGKQVVFIFEGNVFEYDIEKRSTRQITNTVFAKSRLHSTPIGWLYNQENGFGVQEIFLASQRFESTRNLSREIKWPEIHPLFSSADSMVYFTGSKGKGNTLFRIRPADRFKEPAIPGGRSIGPYLIFEGKIAHADIDSLLGNSLCYSDRAGEHHQLTKPLRSLQAEGWSADGRHIIYSIEKEQMLRYYSLDINTLESFSLPILDASYEGAMPHDLLFSKTWDAYPTKTQFYLTDLTSGKFEEAGPVLKNLQSLVVSPNSYDVLLEFEKEIHSLRFAKDTKTSLVIRDGKYPMPQPNGTLIYYISTKNNRPHLFDLATQQSWPIPIPE